MKKLEIDYFMLCLEVTPPEGGNTGSTSEDDGKKEDNAGGDNGEQGNDSTQTTKPIIIDPMYGVGPFSNEEDSENN